MSQDFEGMCDSSNRHVIHFPRCCRPAPRFKPKDEEAGAPQNPRGYAGKENTRRWQTAVASAHRAVREVAAFLLDTGHGALDSHAGVPMTTLARCRHQAFVPVHINGDSHVVWKVGAFQAFVENAELSEDFGRSVHAIQDVHKIGILDLRIVNFDRNLSNMTLVVHRMLSHANLACKNIFS